MDKEQQGQDIVYIAVVFEVKEPNINQVFVKAIAVISYAKFSAILLWEVSAEVFFLFFKKKKYLNCSWNLSFF